MEMGDKFRRLKELDDKFEFLLDVQKLGGLSSATLKEKCDNLGALYHAGEQVEGGWGVTTPVLFGGDFICALLITVFCPHSINASRPTALEMIKITPTMP